MPYDFILCDVFTDRPFAGNQLAVFLDGSGLSGDDMAALAREFDWSEITFVLPSEDEAPRVRIWTPGGELPFAGHPTVGTAVVLAMVGVLPEGASALTLGIGDVAVEVSSISSTGGRATVTQRSPTFGTRFQDRAGLARALSLAETDIAPDLEPQIVSTGLEHFLVPLASLDALERVRPHPDLLPAVLAQMGVRWAYAFSVETPQSSAAARARLVGVGKEDPATGSAAGPLGAYLVHYGLHRAGTLDIEQGVEMGRPSRISVDVPVVSGTIGPVNVSGEVRVWGRGAVEVPAGSPV